MSEELVPIKKTYTIPEYGIVVRVFNGGHGTIVSELRKQFEEDLIPLEDMAKGMVDAFEALLLSHACTGVDITSKGYLMGLHSAIEACAHNL